MHAFVPNLTSGTQPQSPWKKKEKNKYISYQVKSMSSQYNFELPIEKALRNLNATVTRSI